MIITIFDFDDTLFATTYFQSIPTDSLHLAISIDGVIRKAAEIGEIIIVTNATKSWFDLCSEKYLSKSFYLKKYKERVFSSIDNLDIKNVPVSEWKPRAFKKVLKPFFKDKQSHTLFAFGDTDYDRNAALQIREKYKNVNVNSIQLIQKPTLNVLLYEHILIYNFLCNLSTLKSNVDIGFVLSDSEIKQKSLSSIDNVNSSSNFSLLSSESSNSS